MIKGYMKNLIRGLWIKRIKPILEGNSLWKYRIGQTECFSNPLSIDLLNKYFN